jgi:hypothetical protein
MAQFVSPAAVKKRSIWFTLDYVMLPAGDDCPKGDLSGGGGRA